jgi:cold shock CspA family protein
LPAAVLGRSVYSVAVRRINRFIPARGLVAIKERAAPVISGTVTWFDPKRGIGGIAVDGTDRELPVESSEIDGGGLQSLRRYDRVRLTVHEVPEGARALRVWTP